MNRASRSERRERKERVLTQGTPSVTTHIADAIVIKEGNVFFLARRDGTVPLADGHGYGLYYRDCRYLDGYELSLGGRRLNALGVNARRGFRALFQLTNPDIRAGDGKLEIAKEQIGVQWKRVIDANGPALHDRLRFTNFGHAPVELALEFAFHAGFQDVFEVRGLLPDRRGAPRAPRWRGQTLGFFYRGADEVERRLCIHFSRRPDATEKAAAHFRVRLGARARDELALSLRVHEGAGKDAAGCLAARTVARMEGSSERSEARWLAGETRVESDSLALDAILERSLRDLRMLRNRLHGEAYIAAGIPWFGTLFGRDSLIAALQMLAFDPHLAEETLRLLARRQGTRVDAHRDEQPGKILHELRVGELAASGQIPHTPYYGTVDATPLFLILIARHAAWTGRLDLFRSLEPNAARALEWIDRDGDPDADGYVEYESPAEGGLVNQGWKDSGNAIVRAGGKLARPPIALAEVQAYVYRAKRSIAELYERCGDSARARRLRKEARALRARFNRDFWHAGESLYDLALQGDKEPTRVASSNAGHALWAGIADAPKARRTAKRLMAEDLFAGWGVRTLSARDASYNPIGYHLGTVWPHDNAFIAAGLRRYGRDEGALRIFEGLFHAARHFEGYRLPELFAGFSRKEYELPVRYPVACHPQAWAAAAMPYLVTTLLGLQPDAFAGRLRIRRPLLPPFVERLTLRHLRVGSAQVDLRFERSNSGAIRLRLLRRQGRLKIEPLTPL